MEAKGVIVTIVLCLLMLGAGVGGGIYYQMQQGSPSVAMPLGSTGVVVMPQAIKDLGSKVIPSITAFGTVSKISGKTITLTKDGDSTNIMVKDDAKVYAFSATSPTSKTPPTSRQVTFSEIKTGDSVSIALKVLPTGQLEGESVIVLPATSPVPPAPVKK